MGEPQGKRGGGPLGSDDLLIPSEEYLEELAEKTNPGIRPMPPSSAQRRKVTAVPTVADLESDLRIPQTSTLPSRADQETFAGASVNPVQKGISESRVAEARVGRVLAIVGALGWALFLVVFVAYMRLGGAVARGYVPFLRMDPSGSVALVTNLPPAEKGDYPAQAVIAELRRFWEGRYGVSLYHARHIWPKLKMFFLKADQVKPFEAFQREAFEDSQSKRYWRRVTIRNVLVDDKKALPGGGQSYNAQVEWLEEDLERESTTAIGRRLYRAKVIFTIGTPANINNPDAKILFLQENPLNLRIESLQAAQPIFLDVNEAPKPEEGAPKAVGPQTPGALPPAAPLPPRQ